MSMGLVNISLALLERATLALLFYDPRRSTGG